MLAGGYAVNIQVADFATTSGAEEAFVHSVQPFPFHFMPAYKPVKPWPSTKRGIEEDFVLVCEFSEIIGPTSLITIPRDGGKNFDKDSFALKIMGVDYNATNTLRCYARFSIVEDTSVIIEDKEEGVYAYVHHLTLYDVEARGYVRPFCMAYITPDKNKLFSFLEKLMMRFKAVSHHFRSGNQLLFKTDLEQRLADLCYTRDSLQISSNPLSPQDRDLACNNSNSITETVGGTDDDGGDEGGSISITQNAAGPSLGHVEEGTNGPCMSTLAKTQQSLESLSRNIKDCRDILQELGKKMEHSSFPTRCKKTNSSSPLAKQGCEECCSGGSGYHSDSELVTIAGEEPNLSRAHSKSLSSLGKANCHCLGYQPKMVKVDFRRYDISLKSLQKLCGNLGNEAINRLQKLYNAFSRDAVVLKLEQIESSLINPSSSLLTIGRTVQINFLANVQVQSSLPDGLSIHSRGDDMFQTQASTISDMSNISLESLDPLSYEVEFVPGSSAASLDSLYYDVDERLDDADQEKSQDNEDSWLEISINSTGDRTSFEEKSVDYNRSTSDGGISMGSCSETEEQSMHHLLNGWTIPFVNGYSRVPHLCSPIEPVVSRCSRVPVGCYASRLNSTNLDLPGIGIKNLLQQYPYSIHLIYALLSGRTVIIAAKPKYEREVYSTIKTLCLFVPGHSSNQLIVPWHTKPLTMCDLARMKLVGLAKTKSLQRVVPSSVFHFSTVFDYDSARLWTPAYKGTILHKTLSRCKNFRHDQPCIAAIEAMVMTYAIKAYLYYHTYCLSSNYFHPTSENDHNQLSAAHFLAKTDVVQGDAKIVQYWVDIIKQQQISEFCTNTNSPPVPAKIPIALDYQTANFYCL